MFSRPQGLIRAASVRADVRLNVFSLELDEESFSRAAFQEALS